MFPPNQKASQKLNFTLISKTRHKINNLFVIRTVILMLNNSFVILWLASMTERSVGFTIHLLQKYYFS